MIFSRSALRRAVPTVLSVLMALVAGSLPLTALLAQESAPARHAGGEAALVLDLALFFDLAQRAGMSGIQEWLSFYFKSPQTAPGLYPEHDLFIQLMKLKNTLRHLRGEDLITHLGLEYYD